MSIERESDNGFSSQYTELLSERVGGKALSCSDQWFGECANLIKGGRAECKPGVFVSTGQWMDGWESRRSFGRSARRLEGAIDHDWCILRLGIAGVIHGVDIDTVHFMGNAPAFVSVDAAFVVGEPDGSTQWVTLLKKTGVHCDCQNLFELDADNTWTHVRLNIFPDGGVARFRVYGDVVVNKNHFVKGELIDLVSVLNGGRSLACSDQFYSSPDNLLLPGKGMNMGDGWETKRRRDNKNDWCVIKLGLIGTLRKVVVDTAYFKGNFPDRFSLEGCYTECDDIRDDDIEWKTLVPETRLYADQEQIFIQEIVLKQDVLLTHVRFIIYPDGGVSRLRIMGFPKGW
ncbi:MAG: allantoicase [Spongiibacteraceae bacterium]|nr:allantoicase [Spongiibacteraceae bacterium]